MIRRILLIPAIITILIGLLWLYALLENKGLLRILAWIHAILLLGYGFIQVIVIILTL